MKVLNAFSINMLERRGQRIEFVPIDLAAARNLCRNEPIESYVGHAYTALILSTMLNATIPMNRVNYEIALGDVVLVAQFTGTRLPEAATALPEGATIEFWQCRLLD